MSDIPASIKRQAMDRDFQPSVRIGKTGVTENLVEEILGQLKKRKLVKIKINKGIYERSDRAQVWEYLAQETSSVIVLARGNVGVLWAK
ncbi:MAG: YhbY family RNA-binding protein [Candidatus Poseidoniaceae archaeon]|jgi:RNA-binding protein|nr:RNA-binding protein [Euryarchaeota archaeon]MCH1527716.1 YhbY family RNA-binding protein [Candidatus Poseidoniaceae archaeon]|tara:strand:+ start:1101 stop:1367 length:267 start_codon:yes stop_codon:yes gene_type:complete